MDNLKSKIKRVTKETETKTKNRYNQHNTEIWGHIFFFSIRWETSWPQLFHLSYF